MSSILKALKKLESEKTQRDELSTAVASDILRSSRDRRRYTGQQIVVVCVVVSVIAVAGYFIVNRLATRHEVPSTAPINQGSPVVTNLPKESLPARQPEAKEAIPTRNLPRLSGIIYQPAPEDRLAIINDLPVMEGTLVDDFEVKTIFPDRVVLQRGSSEFTLLLNQ